MKYLNRNNTWNIFVIVNILMCLISTVILSKVGSPSRVNSFLITVLIFALILKMVNIKDNYVRRR